MPPILEVRHLKTWFPIKRGILQRVVNHVRAVDGVCLSMDRGTTTALVGESGCGKTTVGKSIVQLVTPQEGEVLFNGSPLSTADRRQVQMIFQDPVSALNPRMLVKDIVAEGVTKSVRSTPRECHEKVRDILDLCGLGEDAMHRYPHEFSGGQRQRISIARALVVDPAFLVCDEPTSALDVSVQASILNLLKSLQERLKLTYLFITHDLSVVEYLADRVAVMYLGQIVEEGPADDLFRSPRHPYTRALLESATGTNTDIDTVFPLDGDVPSPIDPPSFCRFYSRCPKRLPSCKEAMPALIDGVRCFLAHPA